MRKLTADEASASAFGSATFAAFDPASSAHRAAARAWCERLVEIGFGPKAAALLFGVSKMTAIEPRRVAFYDAFVLARDAAGHAARFFVLHLTETEADLRTWLGDDLIAFLDAMAAIVRVEGGWRSIVSIAWIAKRMIVADARAYNVVWENEPADDYVMPPGHDTRGLVRVAPRTPRRRTLDLCCGSGVQALVAAAYSDEVVGVDVNPRALRFARVNAAANGIDRATFVLGDTYAPLGGARFDAILANPPFVPWPDDDAGLLFRGGGARGEDVLARILAGAVTHLEAPGSLAIVADFIDADELPQRVARWQGEERRTLMLLERRHTLLGYAERHAAHLDGDARKAAVLRLLRHYEASGIRTLDYGVLVQDGERGGTQVMRPAVAAQRTVAIDVAAWFAHQRRFARGRIDEATLVLAPGLELVRECRRRADGTHDETYAVEPGPRSMLAATPVSPLAFALLERVGAGTLVPRDMDDAAEVRELGALLAGGYVRIADA
jgi:carbamoyltransferase